MTHRPESRALDLYAGSNIWFGGSLAYAGNSFAYGSWWAVAVWIALAGWFGWCVIKHRRTLDTAWREWIKQHLVAAIAADRLNRGRDW